MGLKSLLFLTSILMILFAGCTGQSISTQGMAGPEQTGTRPSREGLTPSPSRPVELNVFAAASLIEAFSEIGDVFEMNHPGVSVVFNFAGSQQLAQQINEGAPADVFASANQTQMDAVVEQRGIDPGTSQTFVRNGLVVIYPQENPADLIELKDLAKPELKLVFAAEDVPVGQYTLDFLDKATADPAFSKSYREDVIGNVVSYEDNVRAVLTKVALGEADAGIVYSSDVAGKEANQVGRLDIPDGLNVIASYPIVPVIESQHPDLAQSFIDLVLSNEGQNILAKYNFIPLE